MGIDCRFIAKVKNEEKYETLYLDRFYKFQNVGRGDETVDIDDCPFCDEWSTDFYSLLDWLEEATLKFRRESYDEFKSIVEANYHRWEKGIIVSDYDETYLEAFALKIKHWIAFHTAIPQDTDKGLNIPDDKILGAI